MRGIMYKVQLVDQEHILKEKEFDNYGEAYEYSDELIKELKKDYAIYLLENKGVEYKAIRKLCLE